MEFLVGILVGIFLWAHVITEHFKAKLKTGFIPKVSRDDKLVWNDTWEEEPPKEES